MANVADIDPRSDDGVERVLAVTAHPDDIDFGAAGTIASFVRAGIDVTYCVCTDGDAGGFDDDVPRSEIPRIRREEQTAAAKAIGVDDVRFLGYKDGELYVTHELRYDICRVIRQVRPQRMLIQSPDRNWERISSAHPDHLAAGEAAIFAIYPDARNPYAHPTLRTEEGLEAWTVHQVWVMAAPFEHQNHWVDITDTFDDKVRALRAHESQTGHWAELEQRLGGWGEETARRGGLPAGRRAEAFRVTAIP
jgi:LmbE family N-acetylglucosaminyl deacetylase